MVIALEDKDLLTYAIDSGIIDLSYVQEQIDMKKRREYLDKHPYKIWVGKDGKWRTYIGKGDNRKLVKRSTQNDIEDYIIDYYKKMENKDDVITFGDVYWQWRKVQDKMISDNSIQKYNTDFKRYFEGTDFIGIDVTKINEEDIKVFLCDVTKSLKLCKKACKTLFGYIHNVIYSARVHRYIYDDPMEFLQAKQFYKYCTDVTKPTATRVFSDSEIEMLYEQFREDHKENPNYIPTYAVELASLTGMRVGELSALTWENVRDSYIIVDKSEKYNRIEKVYIIDTTKNGKSRVFPITPEIRNLLDSVRKVETQYGFICRWVFANENGRIHSPVISSCIKNKCKQVGILPRGIHAFRRTVNSKMRCEGVSATVAASLLGHSPDVNEQYYTYDISDIKEKIRIVSKINAEIPIAK